MKFIIPLATPVENWKKCRRNFISIHNFGVKNKDEKYGSPSNKLINSKVVTDTSDQYEVERIFGPADDVHLVPGSRRLLV